MSLVVNPLLSPPGFKRCSSEAQTQMALVNLGRSQNKTKRYECESGRDLWGGGKVDVVTRKVRGLSCPYAKCTRMEL